MGHVFQCSDDRAVWVHNKVGDKYIMEKIVMRILVRSKEKEMVPHIETFTTPSWKGGNSNAI